TQQLMQTLNAFFQTQYKPLINLPDQAIISNAYLSQIFKYEAEDMLKNICNNIKMHYIDHFNYFVNVHFQIKEQIKKINDLKLDKNNTKQEREIIYDKCRKVKQDLLNVTIKD